MSLGEAQDGPAELQAIYDGSVDGICLIDVDTMCVLRANPAMCRMFGYSQDEISRLSVSDLHPACALPDMLADIRVMAREQTRKIVNLQCLRKDGSVFVADVGASTCGLLAATVRWASSAT